MSSRFPSLIQAALIDANKSSDASSWVSSQNSSSRNAKAIIKVRGTVHDALKGVIFGSSLDNEGLSLPLIAKDPTPSLSMNLVQVNKTLYEAAQKGNLVSFNGAVEAGADIEYKSGETIYSNINKWDSGYGLDNTSLHIACYKGFIPIAMRLLELNADINSTNSYRFSPLHFASASVDGHVEIARLLLDRRANLHDRNIFEATPLHLASERGHVEIGLLLLNRGADIHHFT